jgi:hypothetical protein
MNCLSCKNRKQNGVADLEFAMVLPIFLILFCGIFYTFYAMLIQSDTEIKCRNTTWKKRNDSHQSTPFQFSENTNDIVESKMTKSIKSGSFFDKFNLSANSQHLLYSGTWDYRLLIELKRTDDFKKEPINKLMAAAGVKDPIASNLSNVSQMITSSLADFANQYSGILQEITQVKADAEKKNENSKKEIQKTIDETQKTITSTQQEIKSLENSLEQKLSSTSIKLNDITTMPEFTSKNNPTFFDDVVNRMKDLPEEEKNKPENAKDRFIAENIDELKQLRVKQELLNVHKNKLEAEKSVQSILN